jgi:threonine aldolase
MRRAMADAEVGDDAWGEDPTAIALQEQCAALFGTEAGLFMPTGTMSNETSLNVLTRPGDEVIVDARSHIVLYELGGPAAHSGVLIRSLESPAGALDPRAVGELIRAANPHTSRPTLVWLENSHNGRGGRIVPLANIREVARTAHEAGVRVFLDGARLFNAAVATGTPVADYAAEVDALTFCFSKGLGAPVGSMAMGSRAFIDELRVVRQRFGGSMRQVGVLCAAAKVALDTGVDRLAEDHERAARLATGWADALPDSVDPAAVETNMVFAELDGRAAQDVVDAMAAEGVRVGAVGPRTIRAVTHRDVDDRGIDRAIAAFAGAVRDVRAA